jgi:type II secretory pathway pseudopilin PulG
MASCHPAADAKEMRRQGELGFTMIEIAIAIGVIGFALVAIIGILPAGMNVQKDNREDTLIGQDAPYIMDAIRNGCVLKTNYPPANEGLNFLTNYVESITFSNFVNSNFVSSMGYSNFLSGSNIIGLLSTPQPLIANTANYLYTTAIIRALSGPAVQQNGSNLATAFRYQMTVQILPFINIPPDTTNWTNPDYPPGSTAAILRSNRWLETTLTTSTAGNGALAYNLYDIRLHFSWPVLPNGNVGPGRQTYRSVIAAQLFPVLVNEIGFGTETNWFFQPLSYTNGVPQSFSL